MRIDSAGNVGINTTSPTERLDVNGTVKATAFSGPLTGNVTGNITGNITGNVTGNVTGTASAIADSTVTDAKVAAGAAIADTKLATISTAGKVSNSATSATNANIASAIVARDASGNFSAGTITANLTGTASAIADGSVSTAKIVDANVTLAKLVTAVQQALVPAGAVQAFAMNSAPAGWLAADGTAVSRSTYAALFAAVSTTYGAGDGSTTFELPDLRGYFVRGSGTNGDGTAAGTFGVKQSDDLKAHDHTVLDDAILTTSTPGGVVNITFPSGTQTRTTSSTGGTETRPKNIAMLYCIKF
jgi:microcystin-dependent protein